MKKAGGKQKVTKGMPSAVLLSIAIHAALFFLAGMLVVFTVVKKKEIEFEPPKAVERPKMKLKKPKVKVKKTSRPKQAKHILAKVNPVNMPEIQLPELSGMGGEGLGEGIIGGFDMMPDLSEPTLFGTSQSIGNDFEGVFYDSKRDRQGRPLPVDTSGYDWRRVIHKFLVRGWDTSVFSRYYRAPRKLYATSLLVPSTRSSIAPLAFGDEKAVGALWMVHYKGKLVCKKDITFRFWGMADEFIIVRVNGELVLATAWVDAWQNQENTVIGTLWKSDSADSRKYYMGNNKAVVGDWITLEPGKSLDMEILIGDNGGAACFFLAVEEEGVEYERNRQGGPILPAFKTTELSHDQLDAIYPYLHEGEVCLTNGPVFRDYDVSGKVASTAPEQPATSHVPPPTSHASKSPLRTWTLEDGRTMEAEFINIFGGKVVLKDGRGKMHKIAKERLSEEGIEYAELASPPEIDINFLKNFRQVDFSGGFYDVWARPPEQWGRFGFQLKQTSAGEYNHELQVEMFAIGKQWRRSRYILLDRQKTSFVPSEQEGRLFEFRSDREVVLTEDDWGYAVFGEKYYGYIVTVADRRGKQIILKSSHKWLPGILDNLKKNSAGNYMDETGRRTYPDRPKKNMRY